MDELNGLIALPEVVPPKALGFKTEEIRRQLWFTEEGETTRWSAEKRQ